MNDSVYRNPFDNLPQVPAPQPAPGPEPSPAPHPVRNSQSRTITTGVVALILEIVSIFTPYFTIPHLTPESPMYVLRRFATPLNRLFIIAVALVVCIVLQAIALALRNGIALVILGAASAVCHGMLAYFLIRSDMILLRERIWSTIQPTIVLGVVAGLVMVGVGIALAKSSRHGAQFPIPAAGDDSWSGTPGPFDSQR